MKFSARQIAEFLHGELVGNPSVEVNNLSKIEEGTPGTLSFLANPKYTHYIYQTHASIVLVHKDFEPDVSRSILSKPLLSKSMTHMPV